MKASEVIARITERMKYVGDCDVSVMASNEGKPELQPLQSVTSVGVPNGTRLPMVLISVYELPQATMEELK